jgi:ribonuclease HI
MKGWKKEIPNLELVRQLYTMYGDKENVKFMHIEAHTLKQDIHSIGNMNADHLACMAIDKE